MDKTEFRTRDRWLTFAFALGPLAALSNLTVCYSLVPTACAHGSKLMLHVTTLVFFIAALAGALIGRHYYNQVEESETVLALARTRWLATVAMILSLSSAVIILAMEIPNVILRSCD
jgi:hypothetical protein